jgi:TonB family protein
MKAGIIVALLWLSLGTGLSAEPLQGLRANGKLVRLDSDGSNWANEMLVRPRPDYPVEDRRLNHQGSGLFRMVFDVKTGLVTDVILRRSTGWRTLDDAVITAMRRARVRPQTWKYFEIPVRYQMARSREEAMENIRKLEKENKVTRPNR